MSNIIDLFTRKPIAAIFNGNAAIKANLDHMEIVSWELPENLLGKLEARYGDHQPRLLRAAARGRAKPEPYAFGCSHNIAWSEIKEKQSRLGYWNSPMPFPASFTEESIAGVLGKQVKNGGTDPLMWMDLKYRRTHNCIELHKSKKLVINTRSDLIAHDEYVDVLDQDLHEIILHIPTYDDQTLRCVEPGAPSKLRRLEAYNKLRSLGFKVRIAHYGFAKAAAKKINIEQENIKHEYTVKVTREVSRALGVGFYEK